MQISTKTLNTMQEVKPILDKEWNAISRNMYNKFAALSPEFKDILTNIDVDVQICKYARTFFYYIKDLKTFAQLQNTADSIHHNKPVKLDMCLESLKLEKISKQHVLYDINAQQYKIMGDLLLEAIEENLGDKFNQDIKDACLESYQYLSHIIILYENNIKDKYS